MPSGAGSGILDSITFTPQHDGTMVLTVACLATTAIGDPMGAAMRLKLFATQSGSTTYGEALGVGSVYPTYYPHVLVYQFPVVGGAEVECGLYGEIAGAVQLAAKEITIEAKVIKR